MGTARDRRGGLRQQIQSRSVVFRGVAWGASTKWIDENRSGQDLSEVGSGDGVARHRVDGVRRYTWDQRLQQMVFCERRQHRVEVVLGTR
ncbi:MAG: hypothetical protein WA988_07110, partial [Candidatus Nanopelagicales bacterium]